MKSELAKPSTAAKSVDMSASAAGIYSDMQYLQNNPDWHFEDTRWKAGEIAAILEKNRITWQTGVEVGCGSGGIVAELARRYPDKSLLGFDVARDVGDFWKGYGLSNAAFFNEDYLASNRQMDLLMLIDVFEHVEDYLTFLRNLSSRASYSVFHIPLDLHIQGMLRRSYMHARRAVGHLHYFTRESALATLTDTGYEIIDWKYTDVAGEANKSHRAVRTKLLNPLRKVARAVAPNLSALLFGGSSLLVLCRPAAANRT